MLRQQTTACDSTRHIGRQARLRYGLMSTVSGGSTYVGTAATVVVGQTLPPNDTLSGAVKATNNGTYPNVFFKRQRGRQFWRHLADHSAAIFPFPRLSFGASGPYPECDRPDWHRHQLQLQVGIGAQSLTSRRGLTFMGYNAPVNTLDVSNSNTPNHVDPTNQVPAIYQRAIVQLNGDRSFLVASVNAYSGNNGRAAILNDRYGQNIYYTVGNAGNGSGTEPTDIVDNMQIAQPNIAETTVSAYRKARRARKMDFNTDIR